MPAARAVESFDERGVESPINTCRQSRVVEVDDRADSDSAKLPVRLLQLLHQ